MMSTLHKSLTIAFLALSILISGSSADLVRAQSSAPEPMATLTPEEQAWLIENPHIRLATLTNQPPFSMMDADGNHTGLLADILTLLSDVIGQRIEAKLVETVVSDTHEVAKEEGIYGSASILKTSRNANEYLLTDPFMTTPFYIYATTKNRSEIRRPADLNGKRVAVPRNHRAVEGYLAGIGGVQTLPTDTPLEQMQKVVSGEADALIGYFTYPYLVNKYLMVDLVLAFVAKSDQGIRIGVNPDHPILHSILNKAIATISDEEIASITARWTEVSREETSMINFTAKEKGWLAEHPEIVLGTPTDYPPMVIKRADGTHVGVLVDLFEEVNRELNTKVRLHIEDSWADVQEKAQNREIDGLAFGGRDPNRNAIYNATDIVLPTYFSVFARSQSEYRLNRFSDLEGMRIGYKKAARPTRSLLEKLPSTILKPYDDHESMTQALLSKEIDVIVAWMSYDHWRKEKLQGTIDNIYLIEEYPMEMVTYIRKDWPELIPILNKTLAALQQDELPRIINKWFGEWPQLSPDTHVTLTLEERAWLDKKHAVHVRIADWPPYLIVNGDKPPQGIVIEYLKLIKERTGIEFKYEVTDQPFAEFLESMKQRQGPDMTTVIVPTPEREQYISFSKTYISSPYVIFIRGQDKPILDISGLTGKTLAVPRGFVVQEQLVRDYPEISQALFDSDEEALESVATGQADAYIGNLTVASHIIHRRGFSSLQVAAAAPFKEHSLSMGNRDDWPELTSIINKALASITEEEKTAIRNKYLAIKYEQGIDKAQVLKWVLIVGGAASGIMLIFIFWTRRLSLEIRMRKQTEKDLKQARDDAEAANQAKSTFLANMSHELRTPLHAILGFSRLLGRESGISAEQHGRLETINRSGEHLLGMVDDILSLAQIEAGRVELKQEVFDVTQTVQEVGQMMKSRAEGKGLRFTLELDPALPPYVQGDAGKLRQVLINLLGNAVKFTETGDVWLRSRSQPMTDDPDMVMLQLEVRDSGPGIPQDRLDEVFETFVRFDHVHNIERGTGLGLAISKTLVERMNGEITIESNPGRGSLFKVKIPFQMVKTGTAMPSRVPVTEVIGLQADQPEWRFLVVDDNPENRILLTSLLTNIGCNVKETNNGEEAISIFQEWHPHFIWMDMRMPVLDGFAATRKIRTLPGGEAVKIVAVTASVLEERHDEILACGCDEVVRKPFRDHEIFESMARQLDIKYLYKDMGEEAIQKERINLTAEMLAGLPPDLLQDLDRTILVANQEAILEVIERIEEHAPDTADNLQALVQNFEIERIHELLRKAEDKD
jgi:signal transduction histidine kinase/CheY-like chemotaxis protein